MANIQIRLDLLRKGFKHARSFVSNNEDYNNYFYLNELLKIYQSKPKKLNMHNLLIPCFWRCTIKRAKNINARHNLISPEFFLNVLKILKALKISLMFQKYSRLIRAWLRILGIRLLLR